MHASTRLRANLRAIWVDGLAWAVMVGMGEQALTSFAVALGLPVPWGGLLATLPLLAGATLQLSSPYWIRRLGSEKRWVVLCATVQALAFLPLAAGALLGELHAVLLYAIASVYWWAALASNPAWSTWVATVVPPRVRVRFFTRRMRWLQVLQVAALIASGLALQAGGGWGRPLAAFAIPFLFALLARTISVACLAQQDEPDPLHGGLRAVTLPQYFARFRHGADGRFLSYALAVQFCAHVAAPFYVPYLLRELSFDFAEVMCLLAASVLGRFLALPLHGRLAERQGVRALLWVGGLGIVPSVVPWLLTERFELLFLAQLAAGVVWAAWDLAGFLSYFDALRGEERTSLMTTHAWANALAIAAGSLLGGTLLAANGGGRAAYLAVFALSGLLRLATLPLLVRASRPPAAAAAA